MTANSDNPNPEIVFRVDSSTRIGSGHLIRCLTLANELRSRGGSIQFVIRELPGHLIGRIEQDRYRVHRLSGKVPLEDHQPDEPGNATGVSQQQDSEETLSVLTGRKPDWLVVDHYGLGADWERALRPAVDRLLVIDDLAGCTHECDVLLDQNWYGADTQRRYARRVSEQCFCLLGPRYALLQPEYAQIRGILPPRHGSVRRILVFFGGSDLSDETGKALDALSFPEFSHLAVDVVIGPNHPDRDRTVVKIRSRPATNLYENLPSLAGLIARADLMVGAGGATTWERICLGLPSLVTTLAANQDLITEPLAKEGLVQWIGRSAVTTVDDYRRCLSKQLESTADVRPLVDGFGTKRVAETIIPADSVTLNLRPAKQHDAILFFEWRNDPKVRAASFSGGAISWSDHINWFLHKLQDRDAELYVAEAAGLPVGQLRFDFEGDEAILSYSIDHIVRGRGWSQWIISEAVKRTQRVPSMGFRAKVKPENVASRKVLSRLGWTEVQRGAESINFRLFSNSIGNRG